MPLVTTSLRSMLRRASDANGEPSDRDSDGRRAWMQTPEAGRANHDSIGWDPESTALAAGRASSSPLYPLSRSLSSVLASSCLA